LGSGLPCWLLVPEVLEAQEVQVVPEEEVPVGALEEWVVAAALAVDLEGPVAAAVPEA